jgi:cyanophycinase
MLRRRVVPILVVLLAACIDAPVAPVAARPDAPVAGKQPPVDPGYTSYFSGSTTDAVTTPLGGALLAGGGVDSDAGMRWLLAQGGARASNAFGDVVVLRTSGSNGYNKYLIRFGANSVNSIVITSVAGANSAYVRDAIAKAEVIFFAGGDQSTYELLWRGTGLQSAVNARIAQGYPVGGTSAGLAVMSEYVYSALNVSATSSTVLLNPFDPSITFSRLLFTIPRLGNLITDSHFVVRDRMGRLLTFLARLEQDYRATAPRGVGVDEQSAVGMSAAGTATVFGAGNGAYFLSTGGVTTRTVSSGTPLTYKPVTVVRVPVGGAFNFATWTAGAGAGAPYMLSATSGVVTSSTGAVY